MAQIKPIVRVELDPLHAVPEICAVIAALLPYNRGHEQAVLEGVRDAINEQLKGDGENAESVRESRRKR
ncbi:hypothetical protein HGI30_16700 [Paenibacillus albicereus]|uniref:Uncharacterized protein n=1 Tax=Paenibacillus albicereus TaxID=2726185 RepID=A0A6H2H055_9BACL|nr:hypothetical protein [Paenibacillus albicereus]QJC53050.1 hypothetical protein HGI30_16700 [Paenibacillus albicereus]